MTQAVATQKEPEVPVKKVAPIDSVRTALERMKPQLKMALPNHLTADRPLRVAVTAVHNTPKLLDCNRTSLFAASWHALNSDWSLTVISA